MRYYERSWDYGTATGATGFIGQRTTHLVVTMANGNGLNEMDVQYRVPKIAIPTVTLYSEATGTPGKIRDVSTGTDLTATVGVNGQGGFEPVNASGGSIAAGDLLRMHWTADARF